MPKYILPLGQQLAVTARAAERALDRRLAEHGATRSTWRVLAFLAVRPAMAQNDLARAMGITGSTLGHHLARLEVEQLIERERDAMDRRSHVVELTRRGRERVEQLRAASQDHEQELRFPLEENEDLRLHRSLERIAWRLAHDGPSELERWLDGLGGLGGPDLPIGYR